MNTEYTIINISSIHKLQNVFKQVASVLEQITTGASSGGRSQKKNIILLKLLTLLRRQLSPRKLSILNSVEKSAKGKTSTIIKSSNYQHYVFPTFSNGQNHCKIYNNQIKV